MLNFFSSNRKKSYKLCKKREKEINHQIFYRLIFIDSARFMANALPNLVNNLTQGIYKIKYKCGHNNKKCETYAVKYKYCNCFLEYMNLTII